MTEKILRWTSRLFAIAIAAFFAMFAMGAAMQTHSLLDGVMHFAPTLLVLSAVGLAWRRPQFGAATFLLFAAGYAVTTRTRLDWILVIAGPLAIAGMLYGIHWRSLRRAPPRGAGG